MGYAYEQLWRTHGVAKTEFPTARAQAEQALALDPSLGTANSLLAMLLMCEYRWEEARRVVDRGLAHNPGHSLLRQASANFLAHQGRTAEALVEIRRAADIDPREWPNHFWLGVVHFFAGEPRPAVESLERAWALAAGLPWLRAPLAIAYHGSGRDEEALEAMVRGLPAELAGLEAAIRQGFTEAGFQGMFRAYHEWLVASSGEPCTVQPAEGSVSLAILGETDAMFACLERAIDDRRAAPFLKSNPIYALYRSDPRFAALLRRMNLAE